MQVLVPVGSQWRFSEREGQEIASWGSLVLESTPINGWAGAAACAASGSPLQATGNCGLQHTIIESTNWIHSEELALVALIPSNQNLKPLTEPRQLHHLVAVVGDSSGWQSRQSAPAWLLTCCLPQPGRYPEDPPLANAAR